MNQSVNNSNNNTNTITRSSGKNESPTFLGYDMDHIQNDASSNSSVAPCVFIGAVTFLPMRCLATKGNTDTDTD